MQIIMKECMGADKPLVSIVMATYNPRLDWFKELLISLNNQSYDNLELLIIDDCSPEVSFEVISEFVELQIIKMPYEINRNDNNLGSTKTFEKLTIQANGDYIAYCDQDDIWEETKIQEMVDEMIRTGATLVCSDLSIIDFEGKKTSDSITEIRKRHIFKTGYGLAPSLVVKNFVVGCAMMMNTKIAQNAIPFEPYFVHDQWLAVCAAMQGRIDVIKRPLVLYRQHNNNQTGILTGVTDKESYYQMRIRYMTNRINSLKKRFEGRQEKESIIEEPAAWVNAREGYYIRPNTHDARLMIRYRRFGMTPVVLELFLPFMPGFIFQSLINLARKGIL